MYGSDRGAARKGRPYRDRGIRSTVNSQKVVDEHPKDRLVLGMDYNFELIRSNGEPIDDPAMP